MLITPDNRGRRLPAQAVSLLPGFVVAVAAIVARWPATRAWWCLDDWGLLARAAGLIPADSALPARWLSQHAWWLVAWPVLGLDAAAHAVLRIALFALGAVLVVRIAAKYDLPPFTQGLAGLLFAATPLSFTPLFWAAGIQELLACVLLLAACDRWLAHSRLAIVLAGCFAALSILAKESGLGFAVVLLLVPALRPWRNSHPRWRLTAVAFILVIAVAEGLLVRGHFNTAPGAAYELSGLKTLAANLGGFGWWMMTPGPRFAGQMTWPRAIAGIAFFAAWAVWAVVAHRRGRSLPLTSLAMALASLAPALPLLNQPKPYMALAGGAWLAVAVADLLPRARRVPASALMPLAVLMAWWGHSAMLDRMADSGGPDRPGDPVVQAADLSRTASGVIRAGLAANAAADRGTVVIYQQPLRPGEDPGRAVAATRLHAALGGGLGPALLANADRLGVWTTDLADAGEGSVVFCETNRGLELWGSPWSARINAGLIDLVVGRPEAAARNLVAALRLDAEVARYRYDRETLRIPPAAIHARADALLARLRGGDPIPGLGPRDLELLQRALPKLVIKVMEAGRP